MSPPVDQQMPHTAPEQPECATPAPPDAVGITDPRHNHQTPDAVATGPAALKAVEGELEVVQLPDLSE